MRGAVKRISALLLSVAMAAGILYMASGCGEADTGAERYTIVYDLNYEGGGERRVTAQEGAKICIYPE